MRSRSKVIVYILLLLPACPLFGQGQWVQYVTAIAGSTPTAGAFLNEKFGFALTALGWFRTADGGFTWTATPLQAPSPSHLNFYFYTPDTIYVNGRWESDDSGYTWRQVQSPAITNCIYIKDGIIYDAGGRMSFDHFKTWKVIPSFAGGATVVGNLDLNIAMWDYGTTYSGNKGATWLNGAAGVEADFGYYVPFTSTCIRAGGDGLDAIQRSLDGGQTWQNKYGYVTARYFTDGIAGEGCTVYLQTIGAVQSNPSGLFQSTDAGTTWMNIGGPPSYDDYPLVGVMSRGSVCMATGIVGSGIWKYKDPSLFVPPQNDTRIIPWFADTLHVNDCDSIRLRIDVAFSACDFIRMHSISIDNYPISSYSATFRQNNIIHTGHPDSAIVTIMPSKAGTYSIIVRLDLSQSDWTPMVFTFPVTIVVSSMKPRLVITPNTKIDLGRKPICLAQAFDSIKLTNPSCELLHVFDVRFETDSLWQSEFSLVKKAPVDLGTSKPPDVITLDYRPQKIGVKSGRIIIITSLGNDTIPVSADTYPDSSRLVIDSSGTLSFGTHPLCLAGGYDTLVLTNPGCTPMVIESIIFDADSLTQLDFSVSRTGPYALTGSTAPHRIFFTFGPLSPGQKSGRLIINTSFGADTIGISALVLPDSRILRLRSDTLRAAMCDSADAIIYVSNGSCRQMRLEAVSLQSPFVLLPISLPVILDPGDSAPMPVRFTPNARGLNTAQFSAKINFYEPPGSEEFDTSFTLLGMGMQGPFSYSVSAAKLTFDTIHACDSTLEKLVIYSKGCDSLPVSAITITGDSDLSFSCSHPENSAFAIASGDSVTIVVSFAGHSAGNRSATMTLSIGKGIEEKILLSGTVIRPRRLLASASPDSIDLGARLFCESRDTLVTLYNPGCDSVRITGVGFSGSGFASDTKFPVVIAPGATRDVHIYTVLDTSNRKRTNSISMNYNTDADSAIAPVIFASHYTDPYTILLSLAANPAPVTSSGSWSVQLKCLPNEMASIHSIDFSLGYSTDLLEYIPAASTIPATGGGRNFHIAPISVAPDSSLGKIFFSVYLAKDTATDLVLSNIIFNADQPDFTGCNAVPLSLGTHFDYLNSCGDPFIRSVLRGDPLPLSAHPNPAQDEITFSLGQPTRLNESIEIYNDLGRLMYKGELSARSIDIRTFSPGIYLARIGGFSLSFLKVN